MTNCIDQQENSGYNADRFYVMVYCIFAYDQDETLLHLCVERLRQVEPGAKVYVASDAAAPIKNAPEGVVHISTNFPRGGNLKGLKAVEGALKTLLWCATDADSDYVVKLDPDTWVNSTDWLLDGSEDYLALEAIEPFCPCGNAYRLSRNAIQQAMAYTEQRAKAGEWHPQFHYPEDRVILAIIRTLRLPHRLIPFMRGMATGYSDELPIPESCFTAAAVHCGEPIKGFRVSREHTTFRMRVLKMELERREACNCVTFSTGDDESNI